MSAIRGCGNKDTELRMMALLRAHGITGSGWPRVLKRFAAEAWRRADAGELADEELHPCTAQWAGRYDRMHTHEDDETARRFQIAAGHGLRDRVE